MSMRDKLAQIIHDCDMERDSFRDIADAIIAALPDMVEPLVWHDYGKNEYHLSLGSVAEQNGNFYRIRCIGLDAWQIEGDLTGIFPTLEAAKAAANAHHRAQAVSVFGIKEDGSQ